MGFLPDCRLLKKGPAGFNFRTRGRSPFGSSWILREGLPTTRLIPALFLFCTILGFLIAFHIPTGDDWSALCLSVGALWLIGEFDLREIETEEIDGEGVG